MKIYAIKKHNLIHATADNLFIAALLWEQLLLGKALLHR